jgi:dTDP-4-amino-4,6-dideoxygalactose transaminase
MANYLPQQYKNDNALEINHNYLKEQFEDHAEIFAEFEKLLSDGQFTLGTYVDECEKMFAERVGAKYAIGVGSGTDAIFLSLKALGVREGDEVITTPFTYIATLGAIATTGAKPVFVDIKEDFNIDEKLIEAKITSKTKCIVPVHWTGRPCEMTEIKRISDKFNLKIVQDACHAIDSKYNNDDLVNYGGIACYSMHPLKNLNVWGDGGFVTTNDATFAKKMSLMRNHGLIDRDNAEFFAYNSRLDSIQAIVAKYLIKNRLENITKSRQKNALYFDELLKDIPEITVNKRDKNLSEVFHLYQFKAKNRDKLKKYLVQKGIDAKIHYPKPMHLQTASKYLGYSEGDFPVTEKLARISISLPVHEFISRSQIEYAVDEIKNFYRG